MATERLQRAKRDYAPWSGEILRAALQNKIGRELKARYRPPQDMPHRLLTLLIQLETPVANKRNGRKAARGGDTTKRRRRAAHPAGTASGAAR